MLITTNSTYDLTDSQLMVLSNQGVEVMHCNDKIDAVLCLIANMCRDEVRDLARQLPDALKNELDDVESDRFDDDTGWPNPPANMFLED